MSHEIAKLLLAHAESPAEKDEAIKRAMELGMPLHEVQEYLDWLDVTRTGSGQEKPRSDKGERNRPS